jgi:purine-binding chemotaxis protein CheW
MSMMEATERMQYLTFQLAGEEYALGILRVREIIQWQEVTRVPTAPPAIRGVLNLRGSVVPVVDLGLKFGLGATEPTRRTCIVIVEVEREGGQTVMGIVADAVSQVMDLDDGDIEPPPSFGTRMRVDFLEGMARMGDRFALVLNVDRLLSTAELLSTETLGAGESVEAEGGLVNG